MPLLGVIYEVINAVYASPGVIYEVINAVYASPRCYL